MTEHIVPVSDDISLCYRADGADDAPAIVLLAGLGMDLTSWPDAFVHTLVDGGYRVIRLDNRDVGRSTFMQTPPPSRWRRLTGKRADADYTLEDMAVDTVGLLDVLGIEQFHIVGASMGGMIAQTIAAYYPNRALSLVSLYSTTGAKNVGQPALGTILRMALPPARDAIAYADGHIAMLGQLASKTFPFDEVYERSWATKAYARGTEGRHAAALGDGISRQIAAINKSGDRTSTVRTISAPTLVINGALDNIVDASGGHATAAAIRGSRHHVIGGLSHHLAPGLLNELAGLIVEHADLAQQKVHA